MVGGVIIAVVGAVVGIKSGRHEGDWAKARADDLVADPLPHAVLLLLRLCLAGSVALIAAGFGQPIGASMLVFMAGFTGAHRIAYNLRTRSNGLNRTRAWWYMGPCRRRIGDSLYDTLFWVLSARSIGLVRDRSGRYLLIRPWSYAMPWALASLVEIAAVVLALVLH